MTAVRDSGRGNYDITTLAYRRYRRTLRRFWISNCGRGWLCFHWIFLLLSVTGFYACEYAYHKILAPFWNKRGYRGYQGETKYTMCKPTEVKEFDTVSNTGGINDDRKQWQEELETNQKPNTGMLLSSLRVFAAVVVMLYMFGKEEYVNRGYTVWFHKLSMFYLMSNIEFLRRFLIVQGIGITLGWYAAIANDLYHHGRFCHILYMNMPDSLRDMMVDKVTGEIFDTTESLVIMCISHALDTFLHPGLVYLFWCSHCDYCGSTSSPSQPKKNPWRETITWPVVISTYAFSRFWSSFHAYYNDGEFKLFYYGFDVYSLRDLDSWFPAYFAEGTFVATVVLYKLFWEPKEQSISAISSTIKGYHHKQKVV